MAPCSSARPAGRSRPGRRSRACSRSRIGSAARRDLALLLFTYLNPLHRRGIARAAGEANAAGFDAVLVTDLPPEEAPEISATLRAGGSRHRLPRLADVARRKDGAAARLSSGFLYVVSRPGTTGARTSLPRDLARRCDGRGARPAISRSRSDSGSRPPESARQAARLADGVVVGSALVAAAERAGPDRDRAVERLARELAGACRR